MLALDKVAICRCVTKSNTMLKLVGLLPQKEEFDEDGTQSIPPGFHVITLPFADDIRDIKVEPTPKADLEQIKKAKKLVKSLFLGNFDSRNFENPALQRHFAYLQALALERDTEEPTPDFVVPHDEGMLKFESIINEFKESVIPAKYDPDYKTTPGKGGNKRKRDESDLQSSQPEKASETASPKTKKRKVAESVPAKTRDWQQLVKEDKIKSLKIPELKAYLKWKKVKAYSSKNKGELVSMVSNHIIDEMKN